MFVKKIQNKKAYSKFSNNLKKFNLFFKLLFLLPNIQIKLLHKLLLLIKKLSFSCKKNLIIIIYKKFQLFYKTYLIKFLKIHKEKKLKLNITTYKIIGTFLFLEVQKKKNKAITYLKFDNSIKKQRFQYYDLVFFNSNFKDFSLYKSFFLKNSRIKWDLSKLIRRKHEETNKYKFAYKSIFIWPFTIVIKPFIIIVKNVFFRPFFIYKKWFKKTFNQKIYNKNKLYSQIYKIITIKANQKNLNNNLVYTSSTYFWYVMQKYYFCIDVNINYNYNNQIIYLENSKYNNIFYRSFKKYKQFFQTIVKKKQKNSFFVFFNFFYKFLKKSFIGLSFFIRLYCLYFFWFLYFINNLFYHINKILFNYWFRFFYFTLNLNNIINNKIFINYKKLYKNFNDHKNFLEFENNINKFLRNIINIVYFNFNYIIKIKLKNNLYKDYFLILFYCYFRNYFLFNIFNNYNFLFNNNFKKNYLYNNNFFDYYYIDNYKYSNIYKLEYYNIQQKIYKKYSDYYKVNEKKLSILDVDGKRDYLELLNKRNSTLLLR